MTIEELKGLTNDELDSLLGNAIGVDSNYCTDLNQVATVEANMNRDQRNKAAKLIEIQCVAPNSRSDSLYEVDNDAAFAGPKHRTIALILTLTK